MSRVANPGVVRAVGIFMIVLAILNLLPTIAFFASGGPELIAADEVGALESNPLNDLMQAVGSFTSPMGVMTVIHAPVLAAVGIALVMLKRWELFAALMLGLDILVKLGVVFSLATVGNTAAAVVPVLFIVVEAVAAVAIYRQWTARRHSETAGEPERVEYPA